jgi:SpoVK/Ycf46/Vps4 family AAA+-type ATPase
MKCKKLDPEVIGKIKTDTIRRNGIVEIVENNSGDMDSIGGLSAIKTWLKKRVAGFTKEAREFGIQSPKGYLIIGISGCGKSEIAKVTASLLKVPMLRLDGGKIFGNFVGDSERNMRTALRTADVMAPCLLFIDELDKALSGSQSSGQCDSGTTSRVVGTLLQWMQDKTTPVFVVATANDVSKLPPETLRRGRFDQIFFVDLPDNEEREQIWNIHIKKVNRKPNDYDLDRLSKETEGYTGAEIASIVGDGLCNAFHEQTEPTTDIFSAAIQETVPLSRTMRERITSMRQWADGRAIRASGPAAMK